MHYIAPPTYKVQYKAVCLGFGGDYPYANRPKKGEIVNVFEEIGPFHITIENYGVMNKSYFEKVNFANYNKKLR